MAYRPEPHVLEAFAAETRRILARRVPLGVCFFVGVVAIAGLIELAFYPRRLGGLAASFSAEMVFCAAAIVRRLQCVGSLGVVLIVASTMAASCSAVICLGRPLRGRSSRIPGKPSLS